MTTLSGAAARATATDREIAAAEAHSAHNYHPLPVVVASAEGAWVTDVEGRRYLDMLAGYSALNFGHGNPRLIAAAKAQLDRVTLTSRAFHHDRFARFCTELAELCGMETVLPMNTGAEAVETAVKTARKWGYQVKGVPDGKAKIVVAAGNFHGRTTTIVSFSTDPEARADFGPYTPGFTVVPYGDLAALEAAVDEFTVAVLLEPIQGEAGVLVPPDGYLAGVRRVTAERGVLFVADEIQSGLGRTGTTFACEHEGVVPDMYVLGKALGGGVVPVSAVVSSRAVLGVFRPGSTAPPSAAIRWPARWALRCWRCCGPVSTRSGPPPWAPASTPSCANSSATARARSPRCAAGACGRASTSPLPRHRPRAVRTPPHPRSPRQGHPRLHAPPRPAAGHHRGGPGLGPGPAQVGAEQLEPGSRPRR